MSSKSIILVVSFLLALACQQNPFSKTKANGGKGQKESLNSKGEKVSRSIASETSPSEGLTPADFSEIFNRSEKPIITPLDFTGEGKSLAFVYQISQRLICKIEFLKKDKTGFSRISIDKNPFEEEENKMTVCIPPLLEDFDGDGQMEVIFAVPREQGGENLEIFQWNGKGLIYISPFKKSKSGKLERVFKNMSFLNIDSTTPPLVIDSEIGKVQIYSLTKSGFIKIGHYAFFEEIEKRSLSSAIHRKINLARGGNYMLRILSKNPNIPLLGGQIKINNKKINLSFCKPDRESRLEGAEKILKLCQEQNILFAKIKLHRENSMELLLKAQVGTPFFLTLEKI